MITRLNAIGQKLGLSPEAIRTITCQAAHETGYFTSSIFRAGNNLFGMKEHKRPVFGKLPKTYKGYATYTDIEGSVRDLIDWNRRRSTLFALENIIKYAAILKEKGYYEASLKEYRNGLLRAYQRFFPESWHKYNGIL